MLLVAAITLRLTAGVEQIAQKLEEKIRTVANISSLLVHVVSRMNYFAVLSQLNRVPRLRELYYIEASVSCATASLSQHIQRHYEYSADNIHLGCMVWPI
jgi:hypothetical protein